MLTPPFHTLPYAADYASAKTAANLLQKNFALATVVEELNNAFTKGRVDHIEVYFLLSESVKETLCEAGYYIYEDIGPGYEVTHITWSSAHVCEGDLYISRRSAGNLLALAMEKPEDQVEVEVEVEDDTPFGKVSRFADDKLTNEQQVKEFTEAVVSRAHFELLGPNHGVLVLHHILKAYNLRVQFQAVNNELRVIAERDGDDQASAFAVPATADTSASESSAPSPKPQASAFAVPATADKPSLPNDGGAAFQALALLGFCCLLFFGLVTVTLDHLARATLVLHKAVADMPTLTFGAWLFGLALAWGVTLALAWLIATSCEHERRCNLAKRMQRPKGQRQGEYRYRKYTLTTTEEPALKHS